MCRELVPSCDLHEIRENLAGNLRRRDACPPEGQPSPSAESGTSGDSLKRLDIGSSLSIPELLAVSSLLTCAARAKAYGRHEDVGTRLTTPWTRMFRALEPLTPVNNEIKRCILSEDEVSDDASPGLRHVRRAMKLHRATRSTPS